MWFVAERRGWSSWCMLLYFIVIIIIYLYLFIYYYNNYYLNLIYIFKKKKKVLSAIESNTNVILAEHSNSERGYIRSVMKSELQVIKNKNFKNWFIRIIIIIMIIITVFCFFFKKIEYVWWFSSSFNEWKWCRSIINCLKNNNNNNK